MLKTIRHTVATLATPFVFFLLLAILFFLLNTVTWRGRFVALGSSTIIACLYLLLVFGSPLLYRGSRSVCWACSLLTGVVLFAIPFFCIPSGKGGDTELLVEHVITKPGHSFPGYGLSHLVPEEDQISAGVSFCAFADERVPAGKVLGESMEVYSLLNADPAFADLGSALGYGYNELLLRDFDSGHYLAIIPRGDETAARPTIVFLHGSAGNFQTYWYILSRLAREKKYNIICPTFGFGNWYRKGGVEAILTATRDAVKRYNLDPAMLHLACLSNGGTGATRVITASPDTFQGVVFISAVIEERPVTLGNAAGVWTNKRVLIIHGDADKRVRWDLIARRKEQFEDGGAEVEELIFRNEDHFIFVSRRNEVLQKISEWVESSH